MITVYLLEVADQRRAKGTLTEFLSKVKSAKSDFGDDFIILDFEEFGEGAVNVAHITAVFEE